MKKIIFYYQPNGFYNLELDKNQKIDCNIIFYLYNIQLVYIGNSPKLIFDESLVYPDSNLMIKQFYHRNIDLMFVLGGDNHTFTNLFSNYDIFYDILKKFLLSYSFVRGIDLFIEEIITIQDLKKLISDIDRDFGNIYLITITVIGGSMTQDVNGISGICNKTLINDTIGKRINWFNVQCYGDFNPNLFGLILENGYCCDQIIYSLYLDNFLDKYDRILEPLENIINIYPDFQGVSIWKFNNSKYHHELLNKLVEIITNIPKKKFWNFLDVLRIKGDKYQ